MYQIGEFNGEKHRKNPLQFTSRKQNHNDYTIEWYFDANSLELFLTLANNITHLTLYKL